MLSELKIVAALNNAEYCDRLKSTFSGMYFEIFDTECDPMLIEINALKNNADIVLISADNMELNSVNMLIDHLESYNKPPYIIALYEYQTDVVEKLMELQISVIKMPARYDLLCKHIEYIHSKTRIPSAEVHTEIREKIHEILGLFNASTKLFGYSYLREALFIASCTAEKLRFSNDVYPVIAKRHDTTSACVERAIRVSIAELWKKSSDHTKNIFFDINSLKNNQKPTNNEFITAIGKHIYNEYERFLKRVTNY